MHTLSLSLSKTIQSRTNEIFWTAARSAVLSGVVASIICTILAVAPSLESLVAPGASHDQHLYETVLPTLSYTMCTAHVS